MEILNLSSCKTNAEVVEKVSERVQSVNIDKLISDLSNDFVFHSHSVRTLYAALVTGNNAILYGPGGYGKSVLIKAVCEYFKIPVTFKVGYSGMTSEELLGLPNMDKLLNESTYETAFENSIFANPGVCILEEFLDADPQVAACLKDVLSEKGFREGLTRKESMISSIIIAGNKAPEDVSIDDSTAAFYMERFPYKNKVMWDSFSASNYLSFFEAYYDKIKFKENRNTLEAVAKLCSMNSCSISPRVASQAGDNAIKLGIEFLDTISAIDTSILSEIKSELDIKTKEEEEKCKINDYLKLIASIDSKEATASDKYMLLQLIFDSFNSSIEISDSNLNLFVSTKQKLIDLRDENHEQFKKEIEIKYDSR